MWYVRDAAGNIMATYETNFIILEETQRQVRLTETPMYGSSRLGLVRRDVVVGGYNATTTDKYLRKLGQKQYELAKHLGNVNAVISDVRIGVDEYTWNGTTYTGSADGKADYYRPKVVSATDYYPFGWTLPGRTFNPSDYRFGHGTQEMVNEIKGVGNPPAPLSVLA